MQTDSVNQSSILHPCFTFPNPVFFTPPASEINKESIVSDKNRHKNRKQGRKLAIIGSLSGIYARGNN